MHTLLVMVMVSLLMMVAPARADKPGAWSKGAPFPEPSEELVGLSTGGKFYVEHCQNTTASSGQA